MTPDFEINFDFCFRDWLVQTLRYVIWRHNSGSIAPFRGVTQQTSNLRRTPRGPNEWSNIKIFIFSLTLITAVCRPSSSPSVTFGRLRSERDTNVSERPDICFISFTLIARTNPSSRGTLLWGQANHRAFRSMSLFWKFLAFSNNYYKLMGTMASELMTACKIFEVWERL